MTHLKKSLALLLAFVMIFSSMSVAGSAAFDASVDGGFQLDFAVKFFRMERNEDGMIIDKAGNIVADAEDNLFDSVDPDKDINWIETTVAKPGEEVKARAYIGTDFYAYSGSSALLFDSRYLDNPTFTDGVGKKLNVNKNYAIDSVDFKVDSATWFSDETKFSQNLGGALVTYEIIGADYFNDFDIISHDLEIKSGGFYTTLLTDEDWVVEYDLTVEDNTLTRTVGSEGTARVPKELAANTSTPRIKGTPMRMFVNILKGEEKAQSATAMYYWDANVTSEEGVITTTNGFKLDPNTGYYESGEKFEYALGIIGTQVNNLGDAEPLKDGYTHIGWSRVAIPAERTFTADIKTALGITDEQAAEQGNVLTAAQVEALTLQPADIANLKYDYEEETLYAVWESDGPQTNYYTYKVYYMGTDGTYSEEPSYQQKFEAESGDKVDLPKLPVEGFTLDTAKSDLSITVKGDKSSVLNAYYARNKHSVNYHYTDNSETPQVQEHSDICYGADVPEFDSREFPAGIPAKPGYTFTGWATDEGLSAPKTMPDEDVNLYPQYEKITYTYIFDATQDGKFESNGERTYSFSYGYGDTPVKFDEEPVKPGTTFVGWEPEEIPSAVTESITFVAQYEDVEYTVKFVDGATVLDEYNAFYGDEIYTEDVPEGYKAEKSWYVEDENGEKTVVTFPYTVTGDTVLNAIDEADVHNADFYVDNELFKSVPTVYGDEIVAPEAPEKVGYTFQMWDPEVGIMDEEGKSFYAIYEIKTTKISFADTGDKEIAPIEGKYNSDITTVVPEPQKKGYTFAGWNTPIPSKMPAEDMVITALWTKNTYSIRFENHDGTLIDVVSGEYDSDVTAPALPVEAGYEFKWNADVPEKMPAENMTIKAERTPLKFSITFDTDGGEPEEIEPIKDIDCGDSISRPDNPYKDGYSFLGWAEVNDPSKAIIEFPETMPAGGLDLIAIWSKNTHNAYFNANGGTFSNGKTLEIVADVPYGDSIPVPTDEPTRTDYLFDGWTPAPDKMANEDMYFDAKWIPNPSGSVEYKINVITINPADKTEITTEAVKGFAKAGETVEVIHKGETSTANHSYNFEDLIDSESNVLDETRTNNTKITVTLGEDNTINIYCKLKSVTATFIANGGEYSDKSTTKTSTGEWGAAIVVPEQPTRAGYDFAGWDKDVETTYTEDETFVAQWEPQSFYAIFNINGEEYAKVLYEIGEKIEAPEYEPEVDEDFSGWSVPANTVMGPADMTFDATLTQKTYTIKYVYSVAAPGAQLPESQTGINYEQTVKLQDADEVEGYTFNGWTYDGKTYAEGDNFTMPNGDVTMTGSYTAIEYDITYNTGDSDVAVPSDAVTSATVGTVVKLPDLTGLRDGYTFKGWKSGDVSFDVGASFTMPAEEVEFDAIWEEIPVEPGEVTVSYSWTGDIPAGVELPGTETYKEGDTVTVAEVPSAEGYTFEGWKLNGVLTQSFVVTKNETLTGVWTLNEVPPTTYQLKLDANKGAFADSSTVYTAEFEENQTVVTPEAPKRTGYKLVGWADEYGNAATIPTKMPNHAVSLKAVWTELYDVTFNVDGKEYEVVTDAGVKGDALPVPSKGEPSKDGYTFAGWVDSEGNPVTTIPEGDVTVEADWEEIIPEEYVIKYYDGATLVKTDSYAEGETIAEYNLSDKEGYTFNGWIGMPADGKMPAEELIVHADWQVNKHDITLDAGEGEFSNGSSIAAETDVPYGTALSGIVPASNPVRKGYEFKGWLDMDGDDATIPDTMPDHDVELTAKWEIKSAKVTFDAGEGAFTDGEKTKESSGDYGSDIEVPADPEREGFDFKGWEGLPEDGKIPEEDITVKAIWEAKPEVKTYKLTINANGGTIDGQPSIVKNLKEGEATGSVSEPVRDGYKFTGWDKTIPETMPAEDVTVNATWEALPTPTHTVTYYLAKDGEIFATKTFEEGETMTHPTPVAEGIVFKDGWVDENGNPLPEKMGDKDLVAYAVIDYVKSYKATYVVEGVTYKEYDVKYGAEIPVPADPTREGYVFAGWTPSKPAAMPAEDLTFTALWEKAPEPGVEFAAKYVVDGNTYALYILEEGEKIPVPVAPTKFGFKFVGWEPEVPGTMPAKDMEFVAQWEIDKTFVGLVIGGVVVSGAIIGTAIGANAALITGISIVGGIIVLVGVAELVKRTHTVTFMVDGKVYRTYKVVEGTKIPVPTDPTKDGKEFAGWDPEVPEKMGTEDLVFEAKWASEIHESIPDTGSAGIAAFAAISGAAAAAFVLANRKKKDEE